jgi:protein-glutamine gamma-glutamyltransferase
MKPKPAFTIESLCGPAILIWGAHTQLIFAAIPMLLLFESRHWIRWRRPFSLDDRRNIIKLCGAILVLVLTFFLVTQRSFAVIYLLLQWLPVCAFPLIVAQAYSTNFPVLLRLLFTNTYFLQKGFSGHQSPINLYYPYFALCLLSASAANWLALSISLYGSMAILVALFLWQFRPRRSTPILWFCLLLLAGGMGFLGHLQLHQLQAKLEQQTAPWLSGFSGESVDPYQANTRMGSIGDLKQSNAIVFRVAGDRPSFPLLLREATYNKYGSASWIATKSKFAPVPASEHKTTWILGNTTANTSIAVSAQLNGGKGILRLPNGTSEIDQLPVDEMKQNQYGTVKVEGGQGAIAYQIRFNPEQSGDSPPTEDDLQIPDEEKPAIRQTLKAIQIESRPSPEVLRRVSAYFEKNFRYSLKQSDSSHSSTPLSAFLLQSRSGHCEYFASATTLLLRGAGIPARYAVGYSVDEFSPMEGQYIVRSRDAHAWVMAYVNGTWRSVDTTPPDWGAQEDAAASPLQALLDLWAFASFKLARIGVWTYGGGAIAVIACIWLWKNRRKFRILRPAAPASITSKPTATPVQEGMDSEFYLIEQKLTELNLNRLASESLQQWLMRLQTQLPNPQVEILSHIIRLHNRYRFDPQGIEPEEREQLRSLSQSWLDMSRIPQVRDTQK